ncbi:dynein regulatory complex protein 10 isoform X2 [Passer montanus]|uniref:dynein regulatory complex protein 10 isoform X2 n=1 Tax=Passer montanus TaxID=9160 RepID=UPI00195F43A1|nr:dynein regulatory complex protein 10 isoform X2 [Passer montanus]
MKQRTLLKGMAAPRKVGIPLSVMKVLDPRQLKPDSTETERILTVLDETIVKLEITRLIPRIIGSLDRYARMLGPEITSGLLEHQKLSMEIQHLLTSPGDAKSMRAAVQHMKCSLRNILRLFLANPLLYHGLKYEIWVRESPADVFIKAFMEFRDFMLERLLTTPDEEKEMIEFMNEISLQVEKNTEIISALQGELAGVIQTRDEEVSRKDKTIEKLKTSMEDLAKNCKADIRLIMEEGEKQQKEDKEASQERCARLKQDIQHLGTQFSALVLEHRASELVLRKTTYEEVQAVYKEEKEQLSLLMEKHAMLLQEYTQIEEERKMLKEKEEEAAKEEARRNNAATCIQAFWKGYLVRSIYKSKLKKGKGKGKGKGKK